MTAPDQPPRLTDRRALRRNRVRAQDEALFLQRLALDEVEDRLRMVNRSFTEPAIVTDFPQIWRKLLPEARIVADEEVLDLSPGAHDLVIHAMGLHWANDPVGVLIQCARALRPDGLFLGASIGGETLAGLRTALAQAESEISGGMAPRVLPMAEIRDLGAALQRAGLALPVADSLKQQVSYADMYALMRDLRAMGEANAMADRLRRPTRPAVFARAADIYARENPAQGGRVLARFELIFLAGWAPHESQQKPLRPGSAEISLTEALKNADKPH